MRTATRITLANVTEKLGTSFTAVGLAGIVWKQLDLRGMTVFLIAGALSSALGIWLKPKD